MLLLNFNIFHIFSYFFLLVEELYLKFNRTKFDLTNGVREAYNILQQAISLCNTISHDIRPRSLIQSARGTLVHFWIILRKFFDHYYFFNFFFVDTIDGLIAEHSAILNVQTQILSNSKESVDR